jgi:hypothetical protein
MGIRKVAYSGMIGAGAVLGRKLASRIKKRGTSRRIRRR